MLRFWETRFTQIKPLKRGGGRRYYRPEDLLLLRGIRALLYDDGYTIKGVQKVLKDRGVRALVEAVKTGESVLGGLAARLHEGVAEDGPVSASAPAVGGNDEIQAAVDELDEIKRMLEAGRPDS